jgi:hypothetical protein
VLFASTIDPESWLSIVEVSMADTKVDRVAFASMSDKDQTIVMLEWIERMGGGGWGQIPTV